MNIKLKGYHALIDRFPLRVITSDKDLDRAMEVVDDLVMRRDLATDEKDYLRVLQLLVSDYEYKAGHVLNDPVTPLELLRFLLEEDGMRQADLVELLGISRGNASEIMSGKRELSKAQILKVAARFRVDPGVFLGARVPLMTPTGDPVPAPGGKKLAGLSGGTKKPTKNNSTTIGSRTGPRGTVKPGASTKYGITMRSASTGKIAAEPVPKYKATTKPAKKKRAAG